MSLPQAAGRWLFCFLAVAAVGVAYSNSLHGGFFLDDFRNIHYNPHVRIESLTWDSLADAAVNSPCGRRWLPNVTLALNYLAGGLDPFGYNLFNLAVHAAAAAALFFLFLLTLETAGFTGGGKPETAAFFAAVLWAVHPLQTNGVSYIVQRMTSMAALFYVLALVFYLKGRESAGRGRFAWWAGAAVCSLAAFFSKEHALLLPLAVFGYEFFFFRNVEKGGRLLLSLAAAAILFLAVSWLVLGRNPFAGIISGYGVRDFTLAERLLTEPRVIVHYLSLFLLPLPSRLNLAYDFPLSHSLLDPPSTLFAIAAIAALALLGIFFFSRDRITSFAIFWFFLNHLVESTVIPLEIIFEHRMYLPDMFLFLPPVLWVWRGAEARGFGRAAVACGVALVALFSVMTWQRNRVWNDDVLFWQDVVAKSPRLSRAYVGLGLSLSDRGEYRAAAGALKRAVELAPNNAAAWLDLGYVYEQQGDLAGALRCYRVAVRSRVREPRRKAMNGIARVFIKQGNYDKGLEWAEKALKLAPGYAEAWASRGAALDLLGRTREAEESFVRAVRLSPAEPQGYYRLALFHFRHRRFRQALDTVSRGLSRAGDDSNKNLSSLRTKIISAMRSRQ